MSVEKHFVLSEMNRVSSVIKELNQIKTRNFYEDRDYSIILVPKIDEVINTLDLIKQKFVSIANYKLGLEKLHLEDISGIYHLITKITDLSNIVVNYENTEKSHHILSLFELISTCNSLNLQLNRYSPGK